jgi:hypothetical protein
MASSLNASTSGGGGVIVTSDATGNLNLQSGGSTVVGVTSTGVAVTGTLSSSGAVTASTTLAVTGASTFTGTGKFATTIGVGNATPAASGSGITFPATQSASSDANTLDDYEEGTWTPTLSGATTAGTTTYTIQTGTYTKIGRIVSACFDVAISAATGTGPLKIGGFPFATAGQILGVAVPVLYSVTFSGTPAAYFNQNGDTFIRVFSNVSNSAPTALNVQNGTVEYGCLITYYTS